MKSQSERQEDRRENGSALMVVGWVLVLFAVVVLYFQPAAARLGKQLFGIIAGLLVAAGLVLNVIGSRMRAGSR